MQDVFTIMKKRRHLCLRFSENLTYRLFRTVPVPVLFQETETADGRWLVESYYKKLPVGSAVLTAEERGISQAETAASNAETQEEQSKEVSAKSGGGIPTPVLLVILVILLAAMAGVIMAILNERRR